MCAAEKCLLRLANHTNACMRVACIHAVRCIYAEAISGTHVRLDGTILRIYDLL